MSLILREARGAILCYFVRLVQRGEHVPSAVPVGGSKRLEKPAGLSIFLGLFT